MLASLLLLVALEGLRGEDPGGSPVTLEGSPVTLRGCPHHDQTVYYIFWYRQRPGEPPELVPGDPNQRLLDISSAAVSDSAVYFCAVRTTASGSSASGDKNRGPAVLTAATRGSLPLTRYILYVYIYRYMYIHIYIQARAQTFWGAGAQTKKKGTQCQKKILTELKHKQQHTDDVTH
ncbi:hypothetical protein EYF80_056844 [Liparis tanakae]|uniref:Ig-like domain-containing protein n=1 Tax=Liparis tanakae TaxID=230148 RepID=A0A4Z2EVU0_9TELE|nr:hypothetical protein EYF80_056844 [Liparis tanakae]